MEKPTYVLTRRALFFSKWFEAGTVVQSERPLTPPFERYNPEKHGKIDVAPVDLDAWVDLVR